MARQIVAEVIEQHCVFYWLPSQPKHSDAANVDTAEDSTSAEPAAIHAVPDTISAADVSQNTHRVL